MNNLQEAIVRACFIAWGSEKKSSRYFGDFLRDRIYQASGESTLADFFERLTTLMGSGIEVPSSAAADMMMISASADAPLILEWFRRYPNVAAIVAMSKKGDREKMLESISLEGITATGDGSIPLRNGFDVPITAVCSSPLAHGDDTKAGNATLFRKMDVLYKNGTRGQLPFYSGNAIRGQIRDLLAKHFLDTIGIPESRTNPAIELWFFHSLYAGGCLEADSAKLFMKETGDNGAVRADGLNSFRDTLPALSLLGSALGSRIICGRLNVCDLRPQCKQWGYADATDVHALYTWEFLTRRDDHEGRAGDSLDLDTGEIEKAEKSKAMIANTQCLVPGTVLHGGIILSTHASELEKSALGVGVRLLIQHGFLGAENRRGFGHVNIEAENIPDTKAYESHLNDNKGAIIEYLEKIGAYHARG